MKALLLTLLLAGSIGSATAQMPPALADSAQSAYARGDHQRALLFYDSLNGSWNSASLLFNIGNCHFKLNDVPRAILYYERALRLAPGAEDIQANLDLARMQAVDRVNELPAFTLGGFWERTRGGRDIDQWARRSLWASLLLFILLSAWVLVRRRRGRNVLLGASGLALVVTISCVALAAYRVREATDDSQAIIMAAKVDVRSEPREGATALFVLHEGTKVMVLQEQNGWSEVRLPNGSVGWMPPSSLVRI
ncbi:MAG: tetratricopeptide repeat protein [Flavobacteriales bacterium]|nr:tetratricopeptide repeat protein [Flavobacteriales bacterium]